ncbi:GNAT family N-acetyltransferase [Adhaeribacter rhizoryzae]|uniref:GNAT family N-acetyltransferase n=1 Tax=Adhaeribacter rhizoryzae TaxID=2607907 RepID=A0A5M6D292_9BACT|nr:GNAT family N-acetyltransferase [Adhaeribacter rhizoryzae]KAA5539255.1 GNAT family N-acetyltransferase [Adhaeribacter rhizoryzae]
MPRYFSNRQINYAAWDACVAASEQRLVYALSWYLDVVSPGWAGLVEEQDGQYVAVMPLPIKQQFGIHYLAQPLFCQQLGFFAITNAVQPKQFVAAIKRHFSLISKYTFNTSNTFLLNPEEKSDLHVYQHYTHHLNLNQSYEAIYQNYSRDRKLNLKRSQKAGLIIRESTDIEILIRLFKEDAATRIRGGVSEAAYGQLQQLYQVLAAKGLATLLYTQTSAGEIDAGCLFVTYGQKIIYLFNAASIAGRSRNGRSLMLDYMIQKYAGQPYIFDFESPADISSIIRVYQGFGAEPAPFYTITQNNLPVPLKFLKKARQFLYLKVIANFTAKPSS